MWKAQKIELTKNSETWDINQYYFEDCYSLKINDVRISNSIRDTEKLTFDTFNYLQDSICSWCGVDGCDGGGRFHIRRRRQELLFIPCFDRMEDLLEYDSNDVDENYGDPECPPHPWYQKGILVIEEDMMPEFLQKLPGLKMEAVPYITDKESVLVREWERLVIEQPATGFMRIEIDEKGTQAPVSETLPASPTT